MTDPQLLCPRYVSFSFAGCIFVPAGLRLIPASTFSSRRQKEESSRRQTSEPQTKPSLTSLMTSLITRHFAGPTRFLLRRKINRKSAFFFMKICVLCRCVQTDRRSDYLPQTEASLTLFISFICTVFSLCSTRQTKDFGSLGKKVVFFLIKTKMFQNKRSAYCKNN